MHTTQCLLALIAAHGYMHIGGGLVQKFVARKQDREGNASRVASYSTNLFPMSRAYVVSNMEKKSQTMGHNGPAHIAIICIHFTISLQMSDAQF